MAQESWKLDQEEAACQTPEGPVPCSNNCGFFGSKSTMNMCSKCYRDSVLAQAKACPVKALSHNACSSAMTPQPLEPTSSSLADSCSKIEACVNEVESSSKSAIELCISKEKDVANTTPSRLINRCFSCRKRVGLTGFKCRCGDVFCSLHRHSDRHKCSYDYKAAGRDAIAKANPVVKADKVDKI